MAALSAAGWSAVLAGLPADDLPDSRLLRRFVAERDEAAFRLLVGRHGPMVLGVCRRVLGDCHAAEDAFQATFLVLVRRAEEAAREQLGPWLHGIALRTAMKAKVAAARRLAHERAAAERRPAAVAPEPVAELGPVLDEELRRLPAHLRAAVVLCDLEGHSRRRAAALLGLPESTLSSRVAAARRRLAERLTARGVTLSLVGLVAVVPATLASRTVSGVLGDAVPAAVASLSNEVLRVMTWPRKLIAAVVVATAATTGTVFTVSADERGADVPRPRAARPVRQALDGFRFLAFDGFDGQLGLNWHVVRPDPSHVSLTKHPGRLTITTQRGSIHGPREATQRAEKELERTADKAQMETMPNTTRRARRLQDVERLREQMQYLVQEQQKLLTQRQEERLRLDFNGWRDRDATKNLYLIDNPLAAGADFTATTCVANFDPRKQYQQAGLILYTDDDHYMKWTYECNDSWLPDYVGKGGQIGEMGAGGRPFFVLVGETAGNPTHHIAAPAEPKLPRVWLRVTKRGNVYDCYTSTDGERFTKRGSAEWGKGGPRRLGLIAQNGGEAGVPEIDAQFEFFELRAR
jgi:RNA polymerase sigma factor (sigma-70 family)